MSDLAIRLQTLEVSLDRVVDVMDRITSTMQRLAEQRPAAQAAAPPRLPGSPDPNVVYSVPIGNSPFRGPKNAKVTMVRAFEFACVYCERTRPTMDQLLADYGKDLRIVYMSYIVHPQAATVAAHAGCAAHKQDKFFEMEHAIWERGFLNNRNLGADTMETIARDIGLDLALFVRDMNGPECAQKVQRDQELLRKVGTRGTPAFYINGRYISGARPVESFKSIIDEELAKANQAIKSGIKQSDYYEHLVRTGQKEL